MKRCVTVSAWLLAASLVGMGMLGRTATASECCPFCSAASQTLRQESLSMDAVAIASLVPDGRDDIDGNATFAVERVLRGDSILEPGQKVDLVYFGSGKSTKKFLLLGVDPRNLVWSTPLPLSEAATKYVDAIQALPDDSIARLEFYQQYFEHPDSLLSRDSYDEFALAPYDDVKKLKDKMNRAQLMEWVRDPEISPDRKRLYFTMLGICGTPEDADEFEAMIRSDEPEKRAGLDALIASYLMLKGPDGLKLIDERFLANRKASYPDVYSAVMALRFHGTEVEALPKDEILKSMRHLLDAPDLADLVIPDLARWGDWSQVDRLSELFKNANEDNSWVRVPVVNYLRACPLPAAKVRLVELEKIDPKAVKRASTFFPIPSPATTPKPPGAKGNTNNSSSYWSPMQRLESPVAADRKSLIGRVEEKNPVGSYAFVAGPPTAGARQRMTSQFAFGWRLNATSPVWEPMASHQGANLAGRYNGGLSDNSQYPIAGQKAPLRLEPEGFAMNSLSLWSVLGLSAAIFAVSMWMVAADMFGHELHLLRRLLHYSLVGR